MLRVLNSSAESHVCISVFFAASARVNWIRCQILVVLIFYSIVFQLLVFVGLLNESMMDAARDYFDAATN